MDECLQVPDERQECLTDQILVQQVQLQLIVEKMILGIWNNGAMEIDEHKKAPLSFYLQALHSQLREFKNKLSPQLQSNGKISSINYSVVLSNSWAEVVLAHLYSTELAVNEITLSEVPIATNHSDFKHLKRLYACVESIKSWFDVFFTIPPIDYIGFPFSIFSQLLHCLVTLYRLSTLQDPAWDKNGVQETIDLLLTLDQVINNMEQVATVAGLDNSNSTEGDVFSRIARELRSIRLEWEAMLRLHDLIIPTSPTLQNVTETPFSEALPVDLADSDWMMDFLLAPDH